MGRIVIYFLMVSGGVDRCDEYHDGCENMNDEVVISVGSPVLHRDIERVREQRVGRVKNREWEGFRRESGQGLRQRVVRV